MKGARQLAGVPYGHLDRPSKGLLGAVEGLPWQSLVHLQTPGPAVIFMPSLHLRADTSSFSVCSVASPLPGVSAQEAKEARVQRPTVLTTPPMSKPFEILSGFHVGSHGF